MLKIHRFLLAASISLAAVSAVSAGPPSDIPPVARQLTLLEPAQYGGYREHRDDQCQSWRRECAKLWGFRTHRWHQCMGQPGAIWDCGGGGQRDGRYERYEGPSSQDQCGNWRRECARLYGWQTQNWYSCMGQPGAIRDCSYRR